MTTRPRFVGLLFSVLALSALVFYFREETESVFPQTAQPPRRGGEVVVTVSSAPRSFNPVVADDRISETLGLLTQAPLVRVNRQTFALEPWLAERWESSRDGLRHTLHLRQGLTWSDGTPLTAGDVVFSLQAALDPAVKSPIAPQLLIGGEPIRAAAPDANTVVLTYGAPQGSGVRLLDRLPILPKHKLEQALASGTFASAWRAGTPPGEIVGAGPFLLREHAAARVVLERNPRYWRRAVDGQALPYVDRVVLEVVADPAAEFLRLASGMADLTHDALRAGDYVAARRADEEGRLNVMELGVALDPAAFWFCLKPDTRQADPRFAFVQRREFRQALSHAVDREGFAHLVFSGEAVPIWGPITPGHPWFSPNVPRYPHDVLKARELLEGIGLEDRDANGILEDAAGTEARFTVLTPAGIPGDEQGATVLREYASRVGVALDIVQMDAEALEARLKTCDYDAVYMRRGTPQLDPAGHLEYWLSSGSAHLWNPGQQSPATQWERQIDELMLEQARTLDAERRRAIFDDVQRILAENVPVLYFAARRLFYAHAPRVSGLAPSVLSPPVLWSADTLSVTAPR